MRIPTFAVAVVMLTASAVSAAPVPSAPLSFTVLRNGEPVGSHIVRFQPGADNSLQVSVDTNVVVKVALIPVYRFEHHGRETWRDQRLVSLDSQTNDDGTHHNLRVAAAADGLAVDGDGAASRLPAVTIPASLWNRTTVTQGTLMNTLDGHAMAVAISDLGEDNVAVGGHPRTARHYAMAGDLNRELWYDADGTLIQVRFKAKDDSDILYVLK